MNRHVNRSQGKKDEMLPVSLYDHNDLKHYLVELLGADRVAGLSAGAITYLASLAHEELPEVPDEIAALLERQDARQFERAQTMLKAPHHDRREKLSRTMDKGMRRERRRTARAASQSSFLDDDSLTSPAQVEAALDR